ncbi:MAG: hypothetical protein WCO77_06985 [bacterium]
MLMRFIEVSLLSTVIILCCNCKRELASEHEQNIDLFADQGCTLREAAVIGAYEGITDLGCYLRLKLQGNGTGEIFVVDPYRTTSNASVLVWHVNRDSVITVKALRDTISKKFELRPIPPRPEQKTNRVDLILLKAFGYDYTVNVYLIRSDLLTSLRMVEMTSISTNWAGAKERPGGVESPYSANEMTR